eukprot:Anaeramoba_ignava/c20035_g3_i1.p3 GENE.c20035_g3_i1~~c20035_g3_i1.p3  ORF type:complete len:185 (+),score=24.77 c20035_g3_i1:1770-2324(+)
MSVLINIIINIIILFFIFHYLKWKLLKKSETGEDSSFKTEAENLIIEINRTTERNLQLIEAKIQQLKEAVKDAERVISVINKEKSGSADESEIYRKLENRSFFENAKKAEGDVIKVEFPLKEKTKNTSGDKNTDNISITDDMDTRERAVKMYRNGIEIELISRNLNIPVGEIELMISLDKAGRN